MTKANIRKKNDIKIKSFIKTFFYTVHTMEMQIELTLGNLYYL